MNSNEKRIAKKILNYIENDLSRLDLQQDKIKSGVLPTTKEFIKYWREVKDKDLQEFLTAVKAIISTKNLLLYDFLVFLLKKFYISPYIKFS